MTENPSSQLRTVLSWFEAGNRLDFDSMLTLTTNTFMFEITGVEKHSFDKAEFIKHHQDHINSNLTPGKTQIREVIEQPGKIFIHTAGGSSIQPEGHEHETYNIFYLVGDKIDRLKVHLDSAYHGHFRLDKRGQ